MSELALVARPAATLARSTIAHHSKSFALASALLGRRLRDETAVVYTWCRRADDAIDVHGRDVASLQAELDEVYAGTAREPVLAALGEVVRARRIPRSYPDELLAGMAMDAEGTHYATLDELLVYCWRVAGVVGLMMSHVFGVADDAALVHAAHLGIAMQLTNICRDVAEDAARGRRYVPDELLANGMPAAVRELLAVAERYYRSGDRGIPALPWRAALAVATARRVYSAIGDRIARTGYDITAGRAVVPTGRKLVEVARAAVQVAARRPRRFHIPTTELRYGDLPRL